MRLFITLNVYIERRNMFQVTFANLALTVQTNTPRLTPATLYCRMTSTSVAMTTMMTRARTSTATTAEAASVTASAVECLSTTACVLMTSSETTAPYVRLPLCIFATNTRNIILFATCVCLLTRM